jgi:hypothetical protein
MGARAVCAQLGRPPFRTEGMSYHDFCLQHKICSGANWDFLHSLFCYCLLSGFSFFISVLIEYTAAKAAHTLFQTDLPPLTPSVPHDYFSKAVSATP